MSGLFWLTEAQWAAIEPFLPKNQPGARRVDGCVLRRVLDLLEHPRLYPIQHAREHPPRPSRHRNHDLREAPLDHIQKARRVARATPDVKFVTICRSQNSTHSKGVLVMDDPVKTKDPAIVTADSARGALSAKETSLANTMIPMLIGGLLLIIVGMVAVMLFVH